MVPLTRRLHFLDALRGAAALLVLTQHSGERLWPGMRHFTSFDVQLGQLGVMVFFLVSGFIVPVSLHAGNGVRGFWISRGFRLWPAYWASLVGVWLVHAAGSYPLPREVTAHPVRSWAAQATMLQAYLGVPNVQGVYWTLAIELAFYVAITVLAATGQLRHSVPLAVLACAGAVSVATVGRLTSHHTPLGVATLATMLVGGVMWHLHSGSVGARQAWLVYALGAVTVQVVAAVDLAGRGLDRSTADAARWPAFAAAWAGAYLAFGLALIARDRPWPRAMVWLGSVSYSLYLFHPVVINALQNIDVPRPVMLLAWVGGSVALAALVHRFVEAPAVAAGRRLRRSRSARLLAAP